MINYQITFFYSSIINYLAIVITEKINLGSRLELFLPLFLAILLNLLNYQAANT